MPKKSVLLLISGGVVSVVILVAGFYVWKKGLIHQNLFNLPQDLVSATNPPSSPVAADSAKPSPQAKSGWNTYKSNNLTFLYPQGYSVVEPVTNTFILIPLDNKTSPIFNLSLQNSQASFDDIVAQVKKEFWQVTESDLPDGVQLQGRWDAGDNGNPGGVVDLLRTPDGIIRFEQTEKKLNLNLFNQIAASFKYHQSTNSAQVS